MRHVNLNALLMLIPFRERPAPIPPFLAKTAIVYVLRRLYPTDNTCRFKVRSRRAVHRKISRHIEAKHDFFTNIFSNRYLILKLNLSGIRLLDYKPKSLQLTNKISSCHSYLRYRYFAVKYRNKFQAGATHLNWLITFP